MPLSEIEALEVAREFARGAYATETRERVLLERPIKTTRHSGGFGTDVLGLGSDYWSFTFQTEQAKGTVMDPDVVIVLVDAETSRAVWFPTL